jgi:SAM-dependent methyltransferase
MPDTNTAQPQQHQQPQFDAFAADYDAALNEGIAVSGEDKNYFARGRILWLKRCLSTLDVTPRRILDFGCGTGSATPFFLEAFPDCELLGIDVSARSIEVARQHHGSPRATFATMSIYRPDASFDLAFCNGVFHHIPLAERAGAMKYIRNALEPPGLFALWENNPWNPATRYVMSRIPFDRDAITLSAPESRRLLRSTGFTVLRTDFLFIFPRLLKWLRPLEKLACKLPTGTQYMVFGRKT